MHADYLHMMISNEQVILAARCIKDSCPVDVPARPQVTDDLMDKVKSIVAAMPDTRVDRVQEARSRMLSGVLDSHDVAEKLIGRVVSDSLR